MVTSPSVQMEFTDMCVWVSNPKSSVKSEVAGQNGVENRLPSQHRPPYRFCLLPGLGNRLVSGYQTVHGLRGKLGFLEGGDGAVLRGVNDPAIKSFAKPRAE